LNTRVRNRLDARVNEVGTASGRVIDFRALRAVSGENLVASIVRRIKRAHILLVDLTPSRRGGKPNPNVLIELGVGRGTGCELIAFARRPIREVDIPSDIKGLTIGSLDAAFEQRLVNRVVRRFRLLNRR
jgi:hypothetical protein